MGEMNQRPTNQMRTRTFFEIVGVLFVLLTLLFGDNIYQQITGRSIFSDVSDFWGILGGKTPTPSQLLLNEQFDNPQYDGLFNKGLWQIRGETNPGIVSHAQSNGVLTSVMQPLESEDSEISSYQQWSIKELGSSEWRVKFDDSVYGDWASLSLGLATESNVRFVCDLKFHEKEKGLSCSTLDHGQDWVRVTKGNTLLQPNTWYILRISVTNNPLEFKVHLDDQLIVSYIVRNPDPWESEQIYIYSALAGDKIKSAITTRIDYVVVTGQ